MRSVHVFVLCALLSAVFCNNSVGPEDCCFKHYSRKLSPNLFKSYDVTDNRCPIMGVILLTKKNNRICANPSHSWVNRIMRILDEAVL
ncbi:C-C motif chemokine 5-like [Syngnathoides biaculeatus]|uniref:C-C motif chemokine 5-like n=1 Tax=Syngnathoides biaculeatus TaxID=300417 RepID=UPI002ADD41A9|nr:C-C motif chemokine 5-like [Syngnathoides biaculeatus]XP_061664575.1 C-C motif chemokine 5-like [Syngnathoides biaculeatus]